MSPVSRPSRQDLEQQQLTSASSLPLRAPAVGGPYAYYVLGVLFVMYLFNFLDRQLLAILLQPIKEDLNIGYCLGVSHWFCLCRVLHFCRITPCSTGRPLGAAQSDSDQHRNLEHHDGSVRPGARVYRLGAGTYRRWYRRSRRDAASALAPLGLLSSGETCHRPGTLCVWCSGRLRGRVLAGRMDQ